jgi:hypothetical protein
MNLETLKMDKYAARDKAIEYGRKVRDDREARFTGEGDTRRRVRYPDAQDKEDAALHKAFCALGREETVLSLPMVMRKAGLDPVTFLPKLAIVRADAKHVGLSFDGDSLVFLDDANRMRSEPHARIPSNLFPAEIRDWQWRERNKLLRLRDARAVCPQIPPRFRPTLGGLTERYLLWEPKWEKRPPDPDPFLLKHIGGGFFTVEAQWHMTPLELAVLEGRL